MPIGQTNFAAFESVLNRLVEKFGRNLVELKGRGYDEAKLRLEFLDPFFDALGWDMKNEAGLILTKREVEIESRADAGRADYLFRIDRRPRFVCEAKKPAEDLHGHAQQAKGYAWTIGVPLALLTDFEELYVYIVGSEPKEDEPKIGLWRTYSFRDFPARARELWDLLARDNVADGIIDRTVQALPKRRLKIGKDQWVVRPSPTENFDTKFLNFLDARRRSLASDLMRHNDRADLLEGTRLNEAVQCILDRLIFIRISEARGIDMGTKLASLLETWQKRRARARVDAVREEPPAHWGAAGLAAPRDSLWHSVVRHIRALDRRPPSHVPFFNGNLLKLHFSEELLVGDEWLEEFLHKICNELAAYKFGYVAVEILGTIYERFLGKIVRPHGRGAVLEEKPEVRKAGGVYYTPRYIVEYIVEQTVGKLLDEIAGPRSADFSPLQRPPAGTALDHRESSGESTVPRPESRAPAAKDFERRTLALRFLDPACGSGSFLLRVFERVCEHWLQWLTDHPDQQKKDWCWVEANTRTVHLTARLKRRILRETVYGVDLDPQAVEVTQLSLYLKMLEGETRETIEREQDLFGGDEAILPPLQDNIKCGNSLIASDFSMMPEDLVRVRAFDWPVQFAPVMKTGGFDAVVGNPPYILLGPEMFDEQTIEYLRRYEVAQYKADLFHIFIQKGISLAREKGVFGMIVPNTWLTLQFTDRLRRFIAANTSIAELVMFDHLVFEDANVFTALLFVEKRKPSPDHKVVIRKVTEADSAKGIADVAMNHVKQSCWTASETCIFETRLTGAAGKLVERIIKGFPALASVARASLGCQAYNSSKHTKEQIENRVFHSDHKKGKDYLPELAGNDVGRYDINRERGQWIKYGPWLHDYRTMDWLEGPRILIREISGPKPHSIFGAYVEEVYCNYKTILNVNPSENTTFSMKYLLGILNSRLVSFLYPFVSNKLVAQAFPRLSVGDVKRLPVVAVDMKNRADKTRHDKLVLLVEKLLALMPTLRAAKSPSDKATLQNAVTATDQQIDALVYDLYGLTTEEIALVESGQ